MMSLAAAALIMPALLAQDPMPENRQTVVLVVGAAGESTFGERFAEWTERWRGATAEAAARLIVIGGQESPSDTSDLDRLRDTLAEQNAADQDTLWLVLIGHGTYDGRTARFNLRGPDVSAEQLGKWLAGYERRLAVVNCASSSAPFINALAGPNRVILTSTKSGHQYNFAHFGRFFSESISDVQSDLDKDGQVSLLEAFLSAAAKVAEYYDQDARLMTEHALLEDNGDGLGTPATWFRGVRAVQAARDGAELDGLRANQIHLIRRADELSLTADQRDRRDELERQIEQLRAQKPTLDADDYYARLEAIVVQLSQIYLGGG